MKFFIRLTLDIESIEENWGKNNNGKEPKNISFVLFQMLKRWIYALKWHT